MKKNGFFQLINGEDTASLKVFPAEGGGEPVKADDVKKYLDDCLVKDYDLQELKSKLRSMNTAFEVKISDSKLWPLTEKMNLTYDKMKWVAAVRFYPPSSDGKYLDKSDIMDELRHQGVVHGILEANIDLYLKNRQYGTNIFVAKATLPIEGRNAVIEYFFNQNNSSKPKLNEDGTVDFHNLDNMSRVEKGEVLARLTPAEQGVPGMDIQGNKIMAKKVKVEVLKKTNQTSLSEDGLTLYSLVAGHVTLVDGKVFVSDTYEIPADVDTSTGDISYGGNVVVKGNVRTGYTIRAKGNIIVNGVVEGASLYAEGDIVLKRGIQGMNRGLLEAHGNIVAKFIENSVVKSDGNIQTEAIMHSKIEARNEISVVGKKGLVTGGELKAGSLISLKVAGSTMGTNTVIEVGIDPKISDRFLCVQQSVTEFKQEKQKLEQVYDILKKKLSQGVHLPEDKIVLLKVIPGKIASLDQEINKLLEEFLDLREQMDEMNKGSVIVENMAYSGVKIIISNAVKFIRAVEHHSKYFKEDGEIKSTVL